MSENSHDYQTGASDVPVEQVTTSDLSNAIDEKMVEQQAQQHQNAEDIEKEAQESKNDDGFDSKFAALSRREKQLREREKQVEARLAEIEARVAGINKPAEEAEAPAEPEIPFELRAKQNPLKALEELGYSYEDLTNIVLNDGKLGTDRQMQLMREELERDYKSKFEELENRLKEKEIKEEEQKYNQVIDNFKTEIQEFVAESGETYELIQANNAYDLVYDVIESYYNENGSILEVEQAAKEVEDYLYEEAMKYTSAKKIASAFGKPSQPANPVRTSPTLSNSHAATGVSQQAASALSDDESRARAASLIKWED